MQLSVPAHRKPRRAGVLCSARSRWIAARELVTVSRSGPRDPPPIDDRDHAWISKKSQQRRTDQMQSRRHKSKVVKMFLHYESVHRLGVPSRCPHKRGGREPKVRRRHDPGPSWVGPRRRCQTQGARSSAPATLQARRARAVRQPLGHWSQALGVRARPLAIA